MCLDCCV
jgi:hypothetical protein